MTKILPLSRKRFIIYGSVISFLLIISAVMIQQKSQKIDFGVTFSPPFAEELGFDWKKLYVQMLSDLDIDVIRIPTYWNRLEPAEGSLKFEDIDFMVEKAQAKNIKILMVIGIKQPRWPECHIPDWARKLTISQRREKALSYIETTVNRYKTNPAISAWQIENEPLFGFGDKCDPPDADFLKKEIALVKSADPSHSIVITETGEWSSWIKAMQLSDVLGISQYRKAYMPKFGYAQYPFPPAYYSLKSTLVRTFFARQNKKTIIAEMQAEPWPKLGIAQTPIKEQINLFSVQELENNVVFAQNIGFEQMYLWGVEWWYYMAKHDHPEYLEYIKSIF